MSDTVAIKEHDRLFDLYDADGCLVGKANPGKKVMLADAFYVPERTCHLIHEVEEEDDEFFDTVELHYYVCSECGWNNRPDAYYCDSCGAKVVGR